MVKRYDVFTYQDLYPTPDGEFISFEYFAELQQERDALAAENAALKYYIDNKCYIDNPVGMDHIDAYSSSVETPATDTFLNAVRAEGVDMVAEAIGSSARQLKVGSKDWMALKKVVFTLVNFSTKLRAPKGDSDAEN